MADTQLFGRAIKVTTYRENVPADPTSFTVTRTTNLTEVTDLRVRFKIHRSLTKHPNSCDVIITNLARATRTDFETKPLLVQLTAGYGDVLKLMYIGDLRFGMTKQEGTDWETLLQLGDGDCHHRWSRTNKTYGAGTSYLTVIKDAAGSMGLPLPKNVLSDPELSRQFPMGTTAHGPTRDELTRLLSPFGYHWSIQNGVLRVLRDDEVNGNVAIPISEETGMIGTPEFGSPPRSGKPPHVTVKMLLYPEISPGDLIELKSIVKSGLFRVEVVRHEGDTHGEAWFTTLEIKPVTQAALATTVAGPGGAATGAGGIGSAVGRQLGNLTGRALGRAVGSSTVGSAIGRAVGRGVGNNSGS